MKKYYDEPTQVIFKINNGAGEELCSGIAYCGEIICGCCGGVFFFDDPEQKVTVLKELSWVDLSEEILGDEDIGDFLK